MLEGGGERGVGMGVGHLAAMTTMSVQVVSAAGLAVAKRSGESSALARHLNPNSTPS